MRHDAPVTGSIYLGGGGSAVDEAALWRVMFAGRSSVVYWPFALAPEDRRAAGRWLTRALSDMGVQVDVDIWTDLSGRTPEQLQSTELLFVGGGNAFRLLHLVRGHGFIGAVRDFVAGGGDYYGGSAGALLACADVELALRLDENEGSSTDFSALGLVRHFDVLPHFLPEHVGDAQEWAAQRGRPVLGIPERSGVALRDGKIEVLGHEDVWLVAEGTAVRRGPGDSWTARIS